jgi:glycosyltransferase involved in cell wall biosynthesis
MLVQPSEPFMGWEEQWGMLMLHAQSCGIPVITTRSGSLEETVLDGKTGILVKPGGDIDGIAAAMRLLVENDVLRTSMGQKGREYIINHFSNESIAERMESYMQSL